MRYPALDQMLEKFDRDYSPEISQEIRSHSSPSAMCGVHAVIEASQNSFMRSSQLSPDVASPMVPFDVFILAPSRDSNLLHFQSTPVSFSLPKAVFLPPPRLLA